jgi:lipopolysaccharide biosynthesis protein
MPGHAARVIAFYLPQFHPIPENDAWWGKGFTEWTNTAKAKPLFEGHYQPHVPADLGFYDLRVPETRAAQAAMARAYGIEAFCYYHYWFAGRRILERPFNEVLASGQPDLPFCLCWANQSWTGVWYGAPDRSLIRQTYPGAADHAAHFNALLPAFRDPRYLTVEGKPLFLVFAPAEIPDAAQAFAHWRRMALEAGLPGLHIVGCAYALRAYHPSTLGLDAVVGTLLPKLRGQRPAGKPTVYDYRAVAPRLVRPPEPGIEKYPCAIPNWDNTPRSGVDGLVLHDSTPEAFGAHFRAALRAVRDKPRDRRLVFVKSWNEWAEGNHLEPDLRFGHRYLEVLRDALTGFGVQSVTVAST